MTVDEFLAGWWAKHGGEILDFMLERVRAADKRAEAAEAEVAALRERERSKLKGDNMEYEVVQDKRDARDWRAEAIGSDGEIFVTIFSGPDAETRAREYADWKALSAAPEPGKDNFVMVEPNTGSTPDRE